MRDSLATPFTKLARTIARNHGIKVVPSRSACCFDGQVIRVPFEAEIASGASLQTLNGMLDHELGHAIAEEEARRVGIATPLERINAMRDKKLRCCFNVVEDVRIETLMVSKYPGARENLDAKNAMMMARRVDAKSRGEEESLWRQVMVGFLARTRSLDDSWLSVVASDLLDGCLDLIERALSLGSVAETEILAVDLKERLEELFADSESDGTKDPEKKTSKAPKADGDGESGVSEPEDGDDGGDEAEDGALPPSDWVVDELEPAVPVLPEPDFEDVGDEARVLLERELVEHARELGLMLPMPEAKEMDRWIKLTQGRDDSYRSEKLELSGQISALRGRLLSRLQSNGRGRLSVGLDEGELDQVRLSDIGLGRRDVHCEYTPGLKSSIAIQLLLDLSGSTVRNNCIQNIRRCTLALAEALEPLRGVVYDVVGFHNRDNRLKAPSDGVHYARGAFEFFVFKEYHERIGCLRGRYDRIQPHLDNCDHEAVWECAKRLSARKEKRKILCVISDGEPLSSGVPSEYAYQALFKTVQRVVSAGIETWGIGAGTAAPKLFYNSKNGARNVCVDELDNLAFTLLSLFSKEIVPS